MHTKSACLFGSFLLLVNGIVNCTDIKTDVKAATKNLGGINCLIGTVFFAENLANDFIYDIEICNAEESDVVSQLLEYSELLTTKTEDVIDLNDNLCKNAAYKESRDAKKSPPTFCARSITNGMDKVNTYVDKILNYLTKNTDAITDSCSISAASLLKSQLPSFATAVGQCAKLYKK